MAIIHYNLPIFLEFGARNCLSMECHRVGISRPLFVTDHGVRAAGVLQQLLEVLPTTLLGPVYDKTQSNPTEVNVMDAVDLFLSSGCDGLIAIGGGSSIDCAKGIALASTHEGPLSDYVRGGKGTINDKVPPLIAVPTTAGTGSEVSRGAIISTLDHRKLGISSWYLLPKVAICDPELTLGLPPKLTAATGMDAIAHCMETFMAPSFNPPADGISLEGLARGWAHIERAVLDGSDKEARLNMMSASVQGALAFQKGLGCVHSLSHSLGGLTASLHHGTLNAVLLPAVIRFNAGAQSIRGEKRLQRMASAMGLNSSQDVAQAILEMNARLGLPSGLREMGVKEEMFDDIISGALLDHCHFTGPRIANAEEYREMLKASM